MRCSNCCKPFRNTNGHRCWEKYGLCGKCTMLLHPSEYVSEELLLNRKLKRVSERVEFYKKKIKHFETKRDFIIGLLEQKKILVVAR